MSQNGGELWTRVSTPHGDNHDMWINPDQPELMIQSNDGGANVSLDGGVTWSTQNNQPTAELYQVDVSDEFPYRLFAGQQDNSTISVPSLVTQRRPGGHVALWESHGGCETGPVVPSPATLPSFMPIAKAGLAFTIGELVRSSSTMSVFGISTVTIRETSRSVSSESHRSMCRPTIRTGSTTPRSSYM